MPERVLTLEQVAELLDVSERTIMRQIKAGKLKAFKVGKSWRFREEAIEEYIKNQEESASQDAGTELDEDAA